MNRIKKTFLYILILYLMNVKQVKSFNRYNVSMDQLANCKEYKIRGTGYVYRDFFHIEATKNRSQLASDENLHLNFYVMTEMDAHVLLTVNSSPLLMDRVYEVVIGAGGNTFSAIRSHMGRRRVSTNTQDQFLLSVFEATPIEIIQKKNGSLFIYIPGLKPEPILTYDDADPLNINYISFSSFGSSVAQWFYDCNFDSSEQIEEVPKYMTPMQKLVQNLTKEYTKVPDDLKIIDFGFLVNSVYYDQRKSVLTSRLNIDLMWTDPEMQWDPSEFNDISILINPDLQFWRPELNVINAAFETFYNFKPKYEVHINSNGTIMLLGQNININTWCLNRMRNWPSEQFSCQIQFKLKEYSDDDFNGIHLKFNKKVPISNETINLLSEWMFSMITVQQQPKANSRKSQPSQILYDIFISLDIARNSSFYKGVFTIPIYSCQLLIMLSFFLRGYRRGALILLVFVVTSMNLLFITKHAPRNYTPELMCHYQNAMWISVSLYLLHITLMWFISYPPKLKPPQWLLNVMSFSPFRIMICMKLMNSSDYIDIQERPWHEIAKILNNIAFIVVNLVWIIENLILLP